MSITKKILICLSILLLIYLIRGYYKGYQMAMEIQRSKIAQVEEKNRIDTMTVPELINHVGGNVAPTIAKISYCESRYNPKAVNYHDGGKNKHSVGILQFQEATFKEWSGRMGEELDYYSSYDQIKVAKYMIEKGQAKQWTCARITKVV